MLDASSGETAGRFLGTLRYAAPEQLRGEKPTAKTDVYSAGLVLYEILAGRGPFDEEGDAHRIAAAHMNKFPLPVSQFVSVPRELDVLLMAALAKNPDARPRDAFSFAASLRNLKRSIEGVQFRDPTENRVTASAVIGPASSVSLAGGRAESNSTETPFGATGSPKTTRVGMPTPTLAPSLAHTSPFPFATTHDARDRAATTNTLGPDTIPEPQHGTEALGAQWPQPAAQLGEASTEIQWPQERLPILSDEPQVRSLPVPASPRRGLRPTALAAVGAVLAVMAVIGTRYGAGRGATVSAGARSKAVLVAPAAISPSSATPVVTLAAPTIAPPRAELRDAPSEVAPAPSVDASPSESGFPPQGKAAPPMAKPRPFRPPAPNAIARDRPGPGF